MNQKYTFLSPVIIGGIGGSGTRLIAQSLKNLNYFIGSDLNNSLDNLLVTLLFKRAEVLSESEEQLNRLFDVFLELAFSSNEIKAKTKETLEFLASSPRVNHTTDWLKERVKNAYASRQVTPSHKPWGWKEPNSHIFLDHLLKKFPEMKYIHVVRNGLDMAFSANQNQLKLWGDHFLDESVELTPRHSLKYWCKVHNRVNEIGSKMGKNFLLLNYDDFCSNPISEIEKLCLFLNCPVNLSIAENISPPGSIGRYKLHNPNLFDKDDIEYVKKLGFDTEF